jgi:hypothetical protein
MVTKIELCESTNTKALCMVIKKEKLPSLNFMWFKASAAKQMNNVLFWVITQHVLAIPYRRFGKTYRPVNFMVILNLMFKCESVTVNTKVRKLQEEHAIFETDVRKLHADHAIFEHELQTISSGRGDFTTFMVSSTKICHLNTKIIIKHN